MSRTQAICVALCGAFLSAASPGRARDVKPPKPTVAQPARQYELPSRVASTALATVTHASYDFEDGVGGPDAQGWTSIDLTAAEGVFFHVDNFSGSGTVGIPGPIAGGKSMWCGTRAGDPLTCGYMTPPGYGNGWDQRFESIDFVRDTGDVDVTFLTRYDLEPSYDFVFLQYQKVSGVWETLAAFNGTRVSADSLHTSTIPADSLGATVRIRFRMLSDAGWSDSDGFWDTDGAMIIDELSVSDSGTFSDFQDFETEASGAIVTADGNWTAGVIAPYGDFAALFDGSTVLQEDSLVTNNTHLWAFYDGSTADYDCGGFPLQPAVPYGNGEQFIRNAVHSPWIALDQDENSNPVPDTGVLTLEFDVYRDLARDALIFYEWHVRSLVAGCPGLWRNDNLIYDSSSKEWLRHTRDITAMVNPAATHIQIAIGVFDGCGIWCGVLGSGDCHSHAPLFDNVALTRTLNLEVVTNTNDSGAGSFRQAILNANADTLESAVTFNIPGPGPHVIQPTGILPVIGSNIVIDGYSQPGSTPNTNPIDQPNNADIRIVIDGSNFGPPGISGLFLDGGNSVVRGIAVGNYPRNGIQVQSNNNAVVGCYVGIDPDGVSDIGNSNGVLISVDDMNNRVGGSDPQDYNVITHNSGTGIFLHVNSRGSVIQGNFIGLTAGGQSAPGNGGNGVHANSSNTSVIGGTSPSERNVISGNLNGVDVFDTDSLTIDGNRIGTAIDGSGSLGNTNEGIFVTANSNGVTVGSTGVGNLIAHNGRDGVRSDPSHVGALTILGNSIDLNGGLGIDIDGDGVTGVNAPVLTGVGPVAQNAIVFGVISSLAFANQVVIFDFYESPACDPSGFGEGARYLGTGNVFIPPPGTVSIAAPVSNPTPGWYITALMRGVSEFSNCVQFINTPTGTNVPVVVGDDGTGNPQAIVTFDSVSAAGATSITESDSCLALPGALLFGDSICWDISTDAVFTDSITICLAYDELLVTGAESDLVLLHYDASITDWVDITTSVDTVANVIYGRTASLSPFALAEADHTIDVPHRPGTPTQFALQQNYPNPFNPLTTIAYDVPAGGAEVTLTVYDVAGRRVATLVSEFRRAGHWSVPWNGTDFSGRRIASGVYFYRLQAGAFVETRKMVLLK